MASTSVVFDIIGRDRASDKFDKLGNAADRSTSKMSKLGSVMKTAGKAAAVGLGLAAVGAGKALWEMGKSAAQDEAAAAQLAQTLKKAAGATDGQIAATEAWISAQGKALGVTDDELRPALANLVTATGDVGKAQKLASLAMDVSASKGKSLESVSTALMKAQNGQVSALSRLGINTKNAAGETITFEQAVKRMGDTFGGAAATKANTLQGKMARLKLILSETGEEIGAKLIPIATKLATWFLAKGLPAIQKFGGWLSANLGPIFTRIGEVWRSVTGGMSGDTSKTVTAIKSVLSDIGSIFRSVVSIAMSIWKHFGDALTAFTKSSFQNYVQIIKGAFQIIAGVFKLFAAILKGDWKGAWEAVKQILKGAWTVIKGVVKQALNAVKLLIKVGWTIIKGITKAAWEGIKKLPQLALEAIKAYIRTSITGYRVLFRAGWDALKNLARAAWEGIKQIVRNGADNLVSSIREIPGKIRALGGAFLSAGKTIVGKIFDGIGAAASAAGGFVSNLAGQLVTAVKNAINDALNLPLTISIHKGPINIDATVIPRLAKGGIVNRPTLALIGEAGPEAVVPLTGQHAPRARATGGSPTVINVEVRGFVGSETQLAREIQKMLLQLKRTNNVELGLV